MELTIEKYTYELPDEKIAKFPVEPRDASKLLIYRKGEIEQSVFRDLKNFIPENTFLVFNNTKVIPARLFFEKKNGVVIEVFLLTPVSPSNIVSQVMETTGSCVWACMIGNKKRFKEKVFAKYIIQEHKESIDLELSAELIDAEQNLVQFSWNDNRMSFASIVRFFGQIPLPPYLKRETEKRDYETYQTVYSKNDGAVAAPTAGLHFTDRVFADLESKKIKHGFITLHVGAGTFQPIKVKNVLEHPMHCEQIVFEKSFIEQLVASPNFVIPVGTTSMRSLESLYWFGVKLLQGEEKFFIEKLFPYEQRVEGISLENSLREIIRWMEVNHLDTIIGETEIFIFPSYKFRVCKGIITNFHQPDSTLMLLVAALVGENWRKIYDFALENDFRFLSYGDSSLLIP